MNETLKTIRSMHSIRSFSKREIPNEDLQTILNAAVQAATASAEQGYSIIVVDDKAVMKDMIQYVGSKALIFCVDYNRLMDLAAHTGNEWGCDSLQQFITGSTDALLAAQNAAVAAHSLGIDTLFTNSVHRVSLPAFYQAFNLPEKHCFPLITLVLGYGEQQPERLKDRWNGPGVIHYGKYHRLTPDELDAMTQDYDNPDKYLDMRGPRQEKEERQSFPDWFFQVWCRQFNTNDNKTMEFYKTISDAGFFGDRPKGF